MATKIPPKTTKQRLLDAAERLFAERGYQGTSLRDLTRKAKANLAAVNYHFRSKEALIEAVLARRLIPINQERLRLLDEAEAAAGKGRLSIEAVLRAFFAPEIRLWIESRDFACLAGRLQYEPDEAMHRIFLSQFDEIIRRFDRAIARALPQFPREELLWRMSFLIGAMDHTWACNKDVERATAGLCSLKDPYRLLERLIAFGVAGFHSPVRRMERSR